jgi:hypothetical protein
MFIDWRCRTFPFRTLSFASWSIIVDPRLILSVSTSQESVTFITIEVQYALADCQTFALVLSCELFWERILPKLSETQVGSR